MIKVYGRVNSSNAAKVFWALDEMKLPYERIDCGGKFGGNDTVVYLQINPHGKVPTLNDGGTIVWESNTILRYLASQYKAVALWPDTASDRAAIDQWMDWSATALVPSIGRVRKAQKISSTEMFATMPAAISVFSTLDKQLQNNQYIAGATFSLADLTIGASIHRWFLLKIEKPEFVHLHNYYERLKSRLAFSKNIVDEIQ